MKNKKVTDADKARVKVFSVVGMKQKLIAAELHLDRGTVGKIQEAENLRPHPGFVLSSQQKKTIRGLWDRHGAPSIAAATGIPAHVITKFMREAGHKKPVGVNGFRRHLTVEELRDLRREIRQSEAAIAKQFGVTHAWLRRFRLKMWGNSGELHWKKKKKRRAVNGAESDTYIRIVNHVCGKLPPHRCLDARLVAAMVDCFAPQNIPTEYRNTLTPAAWQKVRDSLTANLAEAIDTCRAAQESPWKN